jgi:hypothetical protein
MNTKRKETEGAHLARRVSSSFVQINKMRSKASLLIQFKEEKTIRSRYPSISQESGLSGTVDFVDCQRNLRLRRLTEYGIL